ncbi:uncharacterized protein Mb2253c-like [Trifolium pratense]|uniref:uncharacterized protein Mb2253c-like n=1 Tax=Trifolium pratense TaxID=57577 RepID=UPI001E69334A|nr:uncharacterized protein Mb2253c-like [Trifolium pratense]
MFLVSTFQSNRSIRDLALPCHPPLFRSRRGVNSFSKRTSRTCSRRGRSCILEFDGAYSGNPGRSGAGAVLPFGNQVQRFSQGLGTQTNNSIEYQGLNLGLKEVANQGYDRVCVRGDSQLVCNQFEGSWKVNNQNLSGLCNEAQSLSNMFLGAITLKLMLKQVGGKYLRGTTSRFF